MGLRSTQGDERGLLSSNPSPWKRRPPLCHPEQSTCLRQVEGEMTRQKSLRMQGPEGRPLNVSPARKGWEIDAK
jgi:hypothetical protein